MKLLADFRSRVMSAKVKKATAEEGEDGDRKVVEEQLPAVTGTEQASASEQATVSEQATASNEDWLVFAQ